MGVLSAFNHSCKVFTGRISLVFIPIRDPLFGKLQEGPHLLGAVDLCQGVVRVDQDHSSDVHPLRKTTTKNRRLPEGYQRVQTSRLSLQCEYAGV